jgi:hypothetical protein
MFGSSGKVISSSRSTMTLTMEKAIFSHESAEDFIDVIWHLPIRIENAVKKLTRIKKNARQRVGLKIQS